jgi:glycine betaine/proline transport system ATP-binding protein
LPDRVPDRTPAGPIALPRAHRAALRGVRYRCAVTPAPSLADAATLDVDGLWKVFGPGDPAAAIARAESGATRAEILAATGQTIGLRDVSFSVAPGETFVVMGLSGSGKSTLIRCMARIHEPTRGRVAIDGVDLVGMGKDELRTVRRTKMAMVFQHFGLFPHRRVIDNVAYGLEVQKMAKAKRHARAREVLEIVGLTGWAEHYPQQLSGGMQQRVGLARALAVDPEILFFDEPFSALDPLIRRDMQDELCRLQMSMQRTIVFITHDFAEALRLGDRIAIMKDGAFDQVGTPQEIVAAPATDYVREFTRDIDRAKVLTAAGVASETSSTRCERSVHCDTTVEQIVPLLLDGIDAVDVTDDGGAVVGTVTRADIRRVLAGTNG